MESVIRSRDLIGLIDEYRARLDILSLAGDSGLISDTDRVWDRLREDFALDIQEGISRDDLIDVASDELPDDVPDEDFDVAFDDLRDDITDALWDWVIGSIGNRCTACGLPALD